MTGPIGANFLSLGKVDVPAVFSACLFFRRLLVRRLGDSFQLLVKRLFVVLALRFAGEVFEVLGLRLFGFRHVAFIHSIH